MSFLHPGFARQVGQQEGCITVPSTIVYIDIPGAVSNHYEPITSTALEEILGADGSVLTSIAFREVGASTKVPITIPGFTTCSLASGDGTPIDSVVPLPPGSIDPGVVVIEPTVPAPITPTTPGAPTITTPVVVPSIYPSFLDGKNPYFANTKVIGQTTTKIVVAKSVRFYVAGAVPSYIPFLGYETWCTFWASSDNGATFRWIGESNIELDVSREVRVSPKGSLSSFYCCLDITRNRLYSGNSGGMPGEVAIPPSGIMRAIGSDSSQMVIFTSPSNTIFSSTDGFSWTNRGATSGLPAATVPQNARLVKAGNFWVIQANKLYVTSDPNAVTGWHTVEDAVGVTYTGMQFPVGAIPIQFLGLDYNGSIYCGSVFYADSLGRTTKAIVTSTDLLNWTWRYGDFPGVGGYPQNTAIAPNITTIGIEFFNWSSTSGYWNILSTGNGLSWANPDGSGLTDHYVIAGTSILITNINPYAPYNYIAPSDSSIGRIIRFPNGPIGGYTLPNFSN